jgi:cytochrome c553
MNTVSKYSMLNRFVKTMRLFMKRIPIKTLLAGILLTVMLFACGEKPDSKQAPSTAASADVSAGKTIAQNNCAGCHGLDGEGANESIPHLAAQYAGYLVESLNAYREGKRTHAALKDMAAGMTNEDIENVANYYASLPPVKTEQTKTTMISPYEKGKETASACASCHGEDGNSTQAGIPTLAGQQPVYFISAVNDYLSGKRSIASAEKEAMVSALNRVDIESMALYFASQAPVKRDPPSNGDPAAGEPLSANCGGCHGSHGISKDPAIPSLASQDPQYIVKATKAYRDRAREQEDMHKALTDTSDADLQNIAAFYAVQQGMPAQEDPVSIQELAEQCDRCHTPTEGAPSKVVFPKIDGQSRTYLMKALREYRDGERESSTMHKMSLPYSDAIIESLADLYASRPAK